MHRETGASAGFTASCVHLRSDCFLCANEFLIIGCLAEKLLGSKCFFHFIQEESWPSWRLQLWESNIVIWKLVSFYSPTNAYTLSIFNPPVLMTYVQTWNGSSTKQWPLVWLGSTSNSEKDSLIRGTGWLEQTLSQLANRGQSIQQSVW